MTDEMFNLMLDELIRRGLITETGDGVEATKELVEMSPEEAIELAKEIEAYVQAREGKH